MGDDVVVSKKPVRYPAAQEHVDDQIRFAHFSIVTGQGVRLPAFQSC